MTADDRRYSAGDWTDDYCRPCKMERRHTVLVVAGDGEPLRVLCDYCKSQHNFRGGRAPAARPASSAGSPPAPSGPIPVVIDNDRSGPAMSMETSGTDLELLLRRVIREEAGLTPVVPADKWRGGELVLRPGKEGIQEKSLPIEKFFHKIVMLRNRLRVLEQQINGSDLPPDGKLKLQVYITACYGSLTSFNVLFANDEDRFKGSSTS